jgi:hypothetical protein
MDDRLAEIFASLPSDELAIVAAGVLSIPTGRVHSVEYTEITKPHSDARTIGIVRVSGVAATPGADRAWSCVTKLIDLSVPNLLGTTVDPRNEVLVYERGYFTGGQGGLRPARCHHISRLGETLTILWLEDLTEAESPPFDVSQLTAMAHDLGMWNARTAAAPPHLDFPIGRDFQATSAEGFGFAARVTDLLALREEPMVCAMFRHQPVEVVGTYVSTYLALVERSKTLPHALSLADCPISNFFRLPGETIAIDWAGLGNEPVGADGGRFIGSALSWGRKFAFIAKSERHLFETYIGGLRAGGATEDRAVLRAGYLSELGFYLASMTTLPTMLARPKAGLSLEYFEKRLGMPVAEYGAAAADLVDLIPSYIDEMGTLLAQIGT